MIISLGMIVLSLYVIVIIVGSVCLIRNVYVKLDSMGSIVRKVCVKIIVILMEGEYI